MRNCEKAGTLQAGSFKSKLSYFGIKISNLMIQKQYSELGNDCTHRKNGSHMCKYPNSLFKVLKI